MEENKGNADAAVSGAMDSGSGGTSLDGRTKTDGAAPSVGEDAGKVATDDI
jgi:hypothetical protein